MCFIGRWHPWSTSVSHVHKLPREKRHHNSDHKTVLPFNEDKRSIRHKIKRFHRFKEIKSNKNLQRDNMANKGVKWTDEEEARLLKDIYDRKDLHTISNEHGRSERAINLHLGQMALVSIQKGESEEAALKHFRIDKQTLDYVKDKGKKKENLIDLPKAQVQGQIQGQRQVQAQGQGQGQEKKKENLTIPPRFANLPQEKEEIALLRDIRDVLLRLEEKFDKKK